jgi:hypothetical protein
MNFKNLIAKVYLSSLLAALTAVSLSAAAGSPPVVMKLLVLAHNENDISYQSISTYLDQIGVPYDVVMVDNTTPDSSGNRLSGLVLSDSVNGRGSYQGIIQTDGSFEVCDLSCYSLLSAADWAKLDTYAAQFNLRVVSYYTWPEAKWGLAPADYGASYSTATPLNVTLTSAGTSVFPYLNSANPIPVGSGGTIWAYRATPVAAANETTTPLLVTGPYTVAVTHTTSDGRETLALTMDNYPTLLHSLALNYGVINWVTKGVFLGSRRIYLNPQIDDMLLGNWLYAPTLHPECESTFTCPTYLITAPDLQTLADWQTTIQANPTFQSFRTTFAYNGIGSTWYSSTDPVLTAVRSLSNRFSWVSHTWSHGDLDCYSWADTCVPATLDESLSELNQNISVADTLGITPDFTSLVTPYNGGLSNPDFLQAAVQSGIKYIISTDEPPSANIGIVNPLVPSILEIPRLRTNLFDDASSPFTGVYGSLPDEYNVDYGPDSWGHTYAQVQTYNQILDNESDRLLRISLLTYAPNPLAVHLGGVATYDGAHSIYSDLMDALATRYSQMFTVPVLTVEMKDIGLLLAARMSYNASGVVGIYTPGVSVQLTTPNAATVPITGACSQSACDTYGGQVQDNVSMSANATVTLSLAVPSVP